MRVLIIGCGSIGALKDDDIDSPESNNILTHANAAYRHTAVKRILFIDANRTKAQEAANKWGGVYVKSFLHYERQHEAVDIAIVSTPTEYHFWTIKELCLSKKKPKLIICEKPFCSNQHEAQEAISFAKEKGVRLVVNYQRRYLPSYRNLEEEIFDFTHGKCLNTRVLYTRGLRRDGCHALDLMEFFFGSIFVKMRLPGDKIIDRCSGDPTIPIYLQSAMCDSIVFQPCDGRDYGIFEIDMLFEKKRIRLIDNGKYIEYSGVSERNEWGHKSLDYSIVSVIRKETELLNGVYYTLDYAIEQANCLFETPPPKHAFKVHKIIDGVL